MCIFKLYLAYCGLGNPIYSTHYSNKRVFSKILENNLTLISLKLGNLIKIVDGNEIEDKKVMILATMLKTNKILIKLELGNSLNLIEIENNEIGVEGAKALERALLDNKTLEVLNLSISCINNRWQ